MDSKKSIKELEKLNIIYGRVLTVLEAIGAMPDNTDAGFSHTGTSLMYNPKEEKRSAIKSLISQAVFGDIKEKE